MNRVVMINLAGRAHTVEEAGVEAIDAWLSSARDTLAGDPDVDELLLDFERTIGDKCDGHAVSDRDVVTAGDVSSILASLGSVEPATGQSSDPGDERSTATTTELPRASSGSSNDPRAGDDGWRSRKLYRLTDDKMIAGVCSGIAAYARVDVTVVRVAAAVLTFATGGVAAAVYVVMALVVPAATSPEERAAAHGWGATAQDLVERARSGAEPALRSSGRALGRIVGALLRIVSVLAALAVAVVVAAWIVLAAWTIATGSTLADSFDPDTSHWLIALFVTCVAWVAAAPLFGISVGLGRAARAFRRAAEDAAPGDRHQRDRRYGSSLGIVGFATWVAAAAGAVLIAFGASSALRDVAADGQGRITLGTDVVCFERTTPEPTRREACRRGDERVWTDDGGGTYVDEFGVHPIEEPRPPEPPRAP